MRRWCPDSNEPTTCRNILDEWCESFMSFLYQNISFYKVKKRIISTTWDLLQLSILTLKSIKTNQFKMGKRRWDYLVTSWSPHRFTFLQSEGLATRSHSKHNGPSAKMFYYENTKNNFLKHTKMKKNWTWSDLYWVFTKAWNCVVF